MIRIGLTGNIASGKSEIAKMLADRGATVIDADLLAREAVQPETQALKDIVKRWGKDVIKKDGRREDFDPHKLFTGLKKATEKRDISPERLNGIVDQIEADLRRSGRVEIPSGEIGEMVMDRLRDLDEVAYIRFASVYREFMDLQQVKREIEQVLSSRRPG